MLFLKQERVHYLNQWIVMRVRCHHQKQPSRGVFKKKCSKNMQQIYKRTLMPNCNFNKVAKQTLYLLHIFWTLFLTNTSGRLLPPHCIIWQKVNDVLLSKHLPVWIWNNNTRIGCEGCLRLIPANISCFPRRLQDVLKTSSA